MAMCAECGVRLEPDEGLICSRCGVHCGGCFERHMNTERTRLLCEPPPLPEGWEWTENGAAGPIGSVSIDGDRLHIDDGCDAWGPLSAVAAALDAHRDPSWQVHIGRENDGVSMVRIIDGDVWLADPSNARAPIGVVRAVLVRFE
jgi:hypothetical protein